MGQITATRNLVATKVVRLAGQWTWLFESSNNQTQWRTYVTKIDPASIYQTINWEENWLILTFNENNIFKANILSIKTYETKYVDIYGAVGCNCAYLNSLFVKFLCVMIWTSYRTRFETGSYNLNSSQRHTCAPSSLTHYGLVTPYGDIDLGKHWPRY